MYRTTDAQYSWSPPTVQCPANPQATVSAGQHPLFYILGMTSCGMEYLFG